MVRSHWNNSILEESRVYVKILPWWWISNEIIFPRPGYEHATLWFKCLNTVTPHPCVAVRSIEHHLCQPQCLSGCMKVTRPLFRSTGNYDSYSILCHRLWTYGSKESVINQFHRTPYGHLITMQGSLWAARWDKVVKGSKQATWPVKEREWQPDL